MNGIFWISSNHGEAGSTLAVVLRPRGDDWLEDELQRLKRSGIGTLVSMLEPQEAAWLGLAREEALAQQAGLKFLSFPIPDRGVPSDPVAFRTFASALAACVNSGECVGVHCQGSIGRSTVLAASVLMHLGWQAQKALAAIEIARGCMVPDTVEQRRWILEYKAQP